MINDMRKAFLESAKTLGDYQNLTTDELANAYCFAIDNHNEVRINALFSALVLRFWYKVEKIYQTCRNVHGFEREDACNVLCDCLITACKYRGWQDSSKGLNAHQCIQQVIGTRGAPAVLYENNLQKNKESVALLSIDEPQTGDDDAEISLKDTIEDETDDYRQIAGADKARDMVLQYVKKNKLVQAIILDTIAFNDLQKYSKSVIKTISPTGEKVKYDRYSAEFWPHKCIELLGALPENYGKYFSVKYKVSPELFEPALNAVRTAPNAKLYRYLRATLADAKETFA